MRSQRFERERAAALRDSTAMHDTLRGRWAAWTRWKLEDRARRADLAAGMGGASATPSKPPARPWRSKALRDDHSDTRIDPDGVGWAWAVVIRWAGRAALTALLVPGMAVVGAWWMIVPSTGPIRPRALALAGVGLAVVAGVAIAALRPMGFAESAATIPMLWLGVSMIAAASVARDVLGWRPPVTATVKRRGRTVAAGAPENPVIVLDDADEQEGGPE